MTLPQTRRRLLPVALALGLLAALIAPAAPHAAASTPSTATAAYDAQQMFALLNNERAAHGLPALRWNTSLTTAAHQHNYWMAKTNTLSHQLTGEHSLGYRVTAYGYAWRAVAENIGVTKDWSLSGILAVQKMMYNEVAPNDGHRRNILSSTFRDIGIDVRMDATHGKAWITQVFALHA